MLGINCYLLYNESGDFMFDFVFNIMFSIVPIFIGVIFLVTILSIVSPKFRGKMMRRSVKATKYMLNDAKDDLAEIGSIAMNTKKKIITENEDVLKDIAKSEANINKEKIESVARVIKDSLNQKTIYCKYCGALIDEDSSFCKHCGKKL